MTDQRAPTIVAAMVMLSMVIVVTGGVGASPSASSASTGHGVENGNYTADLPFATDHYPRSKNPGGPYNASINQLAATTQELFDKKGAPKGFEEVDYIIVSNQDIDFSECSTSNTAAFGIDRDSDDPGTVTDVGLLSYRKNSKFKPHSIVIEFYDNEDLAAPTREDKGGPGEDPGEKGQGREDGDEDPEVYPDDQVVAHQGYKSGGGPCYAMPEEPGWYQMNGFLNGTSFQGEPTVIDIKSHYFYVCVCDSEREAYEQLGAPPGQENPYEQRSTPTPTPTATPTATPGSTDGGLTPTASATVTTTSGGGDSSSAQSTQSTPQVGQGPQTPTAGSGPGFGLLAALGGVLVAGLLALRRD